MSANPTLSLVIPVFNEAPHLEAWLKDILSQDFGVSVELVFVDDASADSSLDILRRHHPELQVRLIEGAGHWVMYEAADRFNATFLDLLAAPG